MYFQIKRSIFGASENNHWLTQTVCVPLGLRVIHLLDPLQIFCAQEAMHASSKQSNLAASLLVRFEPLFVYVPA